MYDGANKEVKLKPQGSVIFGPKTVCKKLPYINYGEISQTEL